MRVRELPPSSIFHLIDPKNEEPLPILHLLDLKNEELPNFFFFFF